MNDVEGCCLPTNHPLLSDRDLGLANSICPYNTLILWLALPNVSQSINDRNKGWFQKFLTQ